jgi:hypothetical protein
MANNSIQQIGSINFNRTPTANNIPMLLNAGNTPSIAQGLDANRPSAGESGRLYLALDTNRLYQDNGTTWDIIIQSNIIPAFGSNFSTSENLSVLSTTSTTFTTVVTLNTGVIPVGTYRIGVSYQWSSNASATSFISRLLEDGNLLYNESWTCPQDVAGTFGSTGTDQRHPVARTFYTTFGTQTSHTYQLQYRSETAGTIVSIMDSVIEFWRVS